MRAGAVIRQSNNQELLLSPQPSRTSRQARIISGCIQAGCIVSTVAQIGYALTVVFKDDEGDKKNASLINAVIWGGANTLASGIYTIWRYRCRDTSKEARGNWPWGAATSVLALAGVSIPLFEMKSASAT